MIRTAKKVIVLLCWILLFAGMSGCLSGGAQEERISGYSIRADAVELMGDGLHVTTTLIPPQKEQAAAEASYPCIILLIENMDQEVTFEP